MTPLEQMGDSDGTGIDMHQFMEDETFVGPPLPTYFGRKPEWKFADIYEA